MMLRVNVVVFLAVMVIDIVVFLVSLTGFFGRGTPPLWRLMCGNSIAFMAVSIGFIFLDTEEIEFDDEVFEPSGFYIILAIGYATTAGAYALAMSY